MQHTKAKAVMRYSALRLESGEVMSSMRSMVGEAIVCILLQHRHLYHYRQGASRVNSVQLVKHMMLSARASKSRLYITSREAKAA